MRVTVDPIELMTMAVTMGASAVELADVGATIQSCVHCAMPPEVRNLIDQIGTGADTVLDLSASVLRAEAGDVARRALIATHDSLAAASLATAPPSVNAGTGTTTLGSITNPDWTSAAWIAPAAQPATATPMSSWAEFQSRSNFPPSLPNGGWTEFRNRTAGLPSTGGNPGRAANSESSIVTLQLIKQMDGYREPSPIFGHEGKTHVKLNPLGGYVTDKGTSYDDRYG